jgi:ABC-type multidrug transport system permease subunit
MIGSGMESTFDLNHIGSFERTIPYRSYFFPGVLTMIALFSSIFASVSLFEDLQQGFLRNVLVGPASRTAVVLGKCLGSASIACIQVGFFLLLLPSAGFEWQHVAWLPLVLGLWIFALNMSALGFFWAMVLPNVAAYHAIQMLVLVPLWVISGAMFPIQPAWMQNLSYMNPMAHVLTLVHHGLLGDPQSIRLFVPMAVSTAVVGLVVMSVFAFGMAIVAMERKTI